MSWEEAVEMIHVKRFAGRAPAPSVFALGALLGLALAMMVMTAVPRSADAATKRHATAKVLASPRVFILDRPQLHPRAPKATAQEAKRPAPTRARAATRLAPLRADGILDAALR